MIISIIIMINYEGGRKSTLKKMGKTNFQNRLEKTNRNIHKKYERHWSGGKIVRARPW